MRCRTSKIASGGILVSLALSSSLAQANINGSELQNFNAAPSIEDSVTVSSGRTLGQGKFSLGLFANTAANSLPYFREDGADNRDRRKKLNDTVTGLDFQIAYGILDSWDISLAIPTIVAQSVRDKEDFHGEFKRRGNTELRLGTKYQFLASDYLQLAAIGTLNYNRTEDNPYIGDVKFPGASLELALSTQLGIVDWSVNIGHRWREAKDDAVLRETLPIDPAGDQWLLSSGVALDLPGTDVDLTAEVYSAYAESVISDVSSRKSSIAEAIFGFRKPLPYDLEFHAGLGTELSHSQSSSDYRAYLGIRWMVDTKKKKQEIVAVEAPKLMQKVKAPSVLERRADVTLELDDVYFKFDSTEFRDARYNATVAQLASALKAQPIDRVVIEGYACALGTESYNFGLSENRSEAVESMLVNEYQVAPEKLVTVGWGELRPKFDNSKESTRKNNRRVTFKIYYDKTQTNEIVADVSPKSAPEALRFPQNLPLVAVPPPTPGPEGQNVAH